MRTFPTYPLNEVEKDKITRTFPTYPLNEVEKDIHKSFFESGGDPSDLPKLSPRWWRHGFNVRYSILKLLPSKNVLIT